MEETFTLTIEPKDNTPNCEWGNTEFINSFESVHTNEFIILPCLELLSETITDDAANCNSTTTKNFKQDTMINDNNAMNDSNNNNINPDESNIESQGTHVNTDELDKTSSVEIPANTPPVVSNNTEMNTTSDANTAEKQRKKPATEGLDNTLAITEAASNDPQVAYDATVNINDDSIKEYQGNDTNLINELDKTSFLNETISNILPVESNVNDHYAKFTPSKRTHTSKMLMNESFRYDVYQINNQAGFVTERPLIWLNAIKGYSSLAHLSCRWESKKNKDKTKFTEYQLHVCFNNVKHATITLKLATGVMIVKGVSHKLWIENEFTLLQEFVEKCVPTPTPASRQEPDIGKSNDNVSPQLLPPPPPPPPPPLPIQKTKHNPIKKSDEKKPGDLTEEIKYVWEENEKLKRAVISLEYDINLNTSRQNEQHKILETTIETLKRKLEEVEENYDKKLATFSEEIEKLFIKNISNIRDEFSKKITKSENQHASPQQQACAEPFSTPTQNISNLQTQINSINAELKKVTERGENEMSIELPNNNFSKTNELYSQQLKKLESQSNTIEIQQLIPNTKCLPETIESTRVRSNIVANGTKSEQKTSHSTYEGSQGRNNVSTTNNSNNRIINTDTVNTYHDSRRDNKLVVDKHTELIMIMDSNGNHIDYKKLWTINKSKQRQCGNLYEVDKFLFSNVCYSNLKYIFIHVGVNDIDNNSGIAVFNMITELLEKIKRLYPDTKVILSEITPRANDPKDNEVIYCNRLIHQHTKTDPSLFIARHSNLRHPQGIFHEDNKHIKDTCIARLAKNIKLAMTKAYGLDAYRPHLRDSRNTYDERNENQHKKSNHNSNRWSSEFERKEELKRRLFEFLDLV